MKQDIDVKEGRYALVHEPQDFFNNGTKKCVICENIFFVKNSGGGRTRVTRAKNWVTCSRRCSKIYNRNPKKYNNVVG